MVGVKRRVDAGDDRTGKRTKTKTSAPAVSSKKSKVVAGLGGKKGSSSVKAGKKEGKEVKKGKKKVVVEEEEEFSEDDDFDIDDVSDSEVDDADDVDMEDLGAEDDDEEEEEEVKEKKSSSTPKKDDETNKNKTSSRESRAKQKALQQERKAAKPNADMIARSKKLWERLRRKSHVPLEERKKLIAELFDIITGRVKDFVFKHDSVRVIQTALKYANVEQRKQIAQELKGSYKDLAQSRYAKFLIGKLIVHGDAEIRDMVIAEFYGNVKRLIRHPEGSWILDDIYRTVATQEQKANLLREWYGAEFAIFKTNNSSSKDGKTPSAELSTILEEEPAKRGPIMHFLLELINQLIQKKTTGFTMLHDAMLQYFLNVKPGSTEATEFIELIKDDEEGDLVKNLAFTQSGARLMCLALAYSTAKDRKHLTRFYRDTIKMMAGDLHGHLVLLAAYEVIDDTKLTSKLIFPELLNQALDPDARNQELLYQVNDLTARIPILYPFAATDRVKWLLPESDHPVLAEIRDIRKETSKKDPSIRRRELIRAASPTLLDLIAARADSLLETSFGCQFIAEVLFDSEEDDDEKNKKKTAALAAVAVAAKSLSDTKEAPFVGRMLKSLVQGGRFNSAEKKVEKVQPPLNFHGLLYEQIKDEVMAWATGSNVFVIVALTESDEFEKKGELLTALKKGKKALEAAASKTEGEKKAGPVASGAKLLLEKIKAAQ